MDYPNKKNEYGVCKECSQVNLQKICKGCGREPSKGKCEDCKKHLGGGFPFKEGHRSGIRCFECLDINMKKEAGWMGIDHIKEELDEVVGLEGRFWKNYALSLEKKIEKIEYITDHYIKGKPKSID